MSFSTGVNVENYRLNRPKVSFVEQPDIKHLSPPFSESPSPHRQSPSKITDEMLKYESLGTFEYVKEEARENPIILLPLIPFSGRGRQDPRGGDGVQFGVLGPMSRIDGLRQNHGTYVYRHILIILLPLNPSARTLKEKPPRK